METQAVQFKRMTLETKFSAVKGDGSVFSGWASMAGVLDQGGDIVQQGAFKDDLSERGGVRPILWQHNASDPIGSLSLQETSKGLRITEGRLVTDVQRGREAAALIKAGNILGGTSIGYSTIEEGWDRSTGARLLKRLKLHEVSLVTFPMLVEARIDDVKSDERKLRDLLASIRGTLVMARNDREREALDALRGLMKAVSKPNTNELQDALDALRALKKEVSTK
jgi:HK97 family phage prohead protease